MGMRKLFYIISLTLLTGLGANAQVKSFKDIIGKWEIVGQGMNGASLEVIDSNRIYLTYGGEKKDVFDAVLNTKKSPAWFDFKIRDSTEVLQVKTLIHVYSDGVMKWQLFIEDERPEFFTSNKGEMMYLKKLGSGTSVAGTQ